MTTVEAHNSPTPGADNLNAPALFINRHLSLMAFNLRVLEQARNEDYPLLERLQFLLIFSSIVDEFFEVRIAGLKRQISFSRELVNADGLRPQDILRQLSNICHEGIEQQYRLLNDTLLPALAQENISFLTRESWSDEIATWAKEYFTHQLIPVLSPIGLDPAHPFPRFANKSLNFIVSLEGKDAFGRESKLGIVPAPRSLPRIIPVPRELCGDSYQFVFLSSVIHAHVEALFPGMTANGCYQFRITRDADLDVNAAEVEDIARALRGELHTRRFGSAVRLEVASGCPDSLKEFLLEQFNLGTDDLYSVNGPVNLGRLMQLRNMVDRPDLEHPPHTPGLPQSLRDEPALFDLIRQEDILLHHPYQSFTPIIDFLRQAARDSQVLSIKMTLYRTGSSSDIVDALAEAARAGKEVTVVIELRARFDEAENLQLASHLQEAGAVVTYGVVGYKTHAKALLIVRREKDALKRYAHLGTGNYHAGNARLYTDYSLLTADDDICSDIHKIFQQLTGMGRAEKIKKILSAPFSLKKKLLRLIDGEIAVAETGKPGRILIKVNSLTDEDVIRAMYRASAAGVTVDLIVRGMCCLRPGLPGVSDNITVRSVVGRFLEHSRVYYFLNGDPDLFLASADLMERNLMHRVETAFPVMNEKLKKRVIAELELYLQDNCYAWQLESSGAYVRMQPKPEEQPLSAQDQLLRNLADSIPS